MDVVQRLARTSPGNLVAVHFGHHHVQDQQIVNPQLGIFRAGLPVVGHLYLKALALQKRLDGIGQQLFVFDYQNFHVTCLHKFRFHYNTKCS